jgi:ribosomal protein S24E
MWYAYNTLRVDRYEAKDKLEVIENKYMVQKQREWKRKEARIINVEG